jgi:hypothetical protein
MKTHRVSDYGSPRPVAIDRKQAGNAGRDRALGCLRQVQSAREPAQFKTWRLLIILCGLFCPAVATNAQPFSIDWFTIDEGGGTGAGGAFVVAGTIGQPDANAQPLTGGNFSLTGGFWSLFALQTPGAPRLTIQLASPNAAVVLWPSPSTGFLLQQNADMNTTNWIAAPQSVSDNGTNKFIIVSPPAGNRFYRLFKP